MTILSRTTLLVLLTAAIAGAQTVVGRNDETWTTRERLASGQLLHLISPNGAITITQGSGAEVQVRAEKSISNAARFSDMGFKVVRTSAGLTICAVYDDNDGCDMDKGYSSARRNWSGGNRTRASYIVQVPAGVRVRTNTGNGEVTISGAGSEVTASTGNGRMRISNTSGRVSARTGNGDIMISDVGGAVDASTGNGDVRVETSTGTVDAHSGNGDIYASMAELSRTASMEFSTGSGKITLVLPETFGAEFAASTGNGSIRSQLPLRIDGRPNRQRVNGTLGGGGGTLSARTGNGDIEIRTVAR